jgi:dihydropteroate synthase
MFTEYKPYSLKIKNKPFSLESPCVMGILNTTEDSFYDGGKFRTIEKALKQTEKLLLEGASIIDIGGQSTRPGAEQISLDDEINRTAPVIEAIMKTFPDAVLSIDTYQAQVAKHAIEAGASIINDVSAGEDDIDMLRTVAALQVPYIAMHKKGRPKTMQNSPEYRDVNAEILAYFQEKLKLYDSLQIENVILDPGFGFGKTLKHNYEILNKLDALHQLNRPVLVGVSRKSMIWKLLETDPEHALNGTTFVHTIALLKGAHIIRAHDVKEAVECVKLTETLRDSQ